MLDESVFFWYTPCVGWDRVSRVFVLPYGKQITIRNDTARVTAASFDSRPRHILGFFGVWNYRLRYVRGRIFFCPPDNRFIDRARIVRRIIVRRIMGWSNQIAVPRHFQDLRARLITLLTQDGFTEIELRVPALGSEAFLQIIHDSENFSAELIAGNGACPIRAERWLLRLAISLTGKSLVDLPPLSRSAIAHAAIVLGGHPELLQ